jgi:hypothetical protein
MQSLTTEVLLVITLVAVVFGSLMGFLYLTTKSDLNLLQSKYTKLQEDYKDTIESKAKVVEGNKQDDAISTDKQEKVLNLEAEKQALIEKLNKLPVRSPCVKQVGKQDEGNTTPPIDIDAKLPDDIIAITRMHNIQDKRSSGSNSR